MKTDYLPQHTNAFYRRTQRAPVLSWLFICLTGSVFVLTLAYPSLPLEPLLLLLALLGGLLYTFSTVTVEVARERVIVWFGLPIDRVAIPIEDILEHQEVTIPAWRKTGLRLSFDASRWLFGFLSPEGVELKLADGRTLTIGTDRPDELCAAISRATLSKALAETQTEMTPSR